MYRFKHHVACTRKDVDPCQQVLEDVKKMILDVLVKNKKATKKRKVFQYIGTNEDIDEEGISSVDKEKRVASGSGSTQTTIN
jgi:hypothetical protein